jgi:hypothetical protein
VRVRIRKTPIEHEIDGVELDRLTPGRVCDVSPSLGSWLLAEEYAALEMRSSAMIEDADFTAPAKERGTSTIKRAPRQFAADRRHRGH